MTNETIEVRILSRRDEAEGIIALRCAPLDGKTLPPFEAGAHLDVYLPSGLVRQYSLCNDPADSRGYRLGILLEADGRGGSAEIHRDFTEGHEFRISIPRNNFNLDRTAKHSILLAGGIGITPLLAMAFELHATGKSFELHYLSRSRKRAAFVEELKAAEFRDRVHIYYDDEPAKSRFDVDQHLGEPNFGKHVYVCGPKGFMDAMVATASKHGWPDDRVHMEYFTADVETSGGSFIVMTRRSGKMVTVKADQTIAEALTAADLDLLLSCEEGVCGTCLTKVIEGIPDHRDSYQTKAQKDRNERIALCCSRSKSPILVLDL